MIRTLIIEDEQPAANRLEKLLKKLNNEIEVLAVLDTVESALHWFQNNPAPDLIMLDIQLGDGLSFDIFSITKVESYVIFTTAFDEYAIRAFELNSIDYLLKPVSETKLSVSIDKFRKFQALSQTLNIQKLLETIENRNDKFKKRFVVSIANKIKVIEAGEIAYLFSREKNTFLCTVDNHQYPLEFSLDSLEEILNPEIFFRVNRQYIVQYRVINRISILSKSRIRIDILPAAAEEILVSTGRTTEFRHWLDR